MSKVANFKTSYAPSARAAQAKYGINQYFIMSAAAMETGWGLSKIAKQANNFFGITSFGKPNIYWNGAKHGASTGLSFRKYTSVQNSFFDYGRLITTASMYKKVAAAKTIQDFAVAVSESPYLSEANGDNRVLYRKGLIKCYNLLTGENVSDVGNDNNTIIFGLGLIGLIYYATK